VAVVLAGRVGLKMQSDPELPGGGVTHSVGDLGPGDAFGETELVLDPRRPCFLCSYYVEQPVELLLLLREDFDRLLRDHSHARMKKKYQDLKHSGVFAGWPTGDLLRLASMAQIKVFPRNTTIVQQAVQPQSLFFLTKGVCRVMKYPDREAQVRRKVEELNKELHRLNIKYTYHHTLRGKGVDAYINEWGPNHNTLSEQKKIELEAEIKFWEDQLAGIKKRPGTADKTKDGRQVATLLPPAIFGEMAALDPHKGVALGSVVSDTLVETLRVHKIVLQTFDISDEVLARLRRKGARCPDDLALAARAEADDAWAKKRQRVVAAMKLNDVKLRSIKPSQRVKIKGDDAENNKEGGNKHNYQPRNPLALPDISRSRLV